MAKEVTVRLPLVRPWMAQVRHHLAPLAEMTNGAPSPDELQMAAHEMRALAEQFERAAARPFPEGVA